MMEKITTLATLQRFLREQAMQLCASLYEFLHIFTLDKSFEANRKAGKRVRYYPIDLGQSIDSNQKCTGTQQTWPGA